MKLKTNLSYEDVKSVYDKEKDGRIKQRLLIILQAFKIKSSYKIAAMADTSHTKVQRWIKRFNKSGIGGLYDKKRCGRPAFLGSKEKKILEENLDQPKEFSVGWRTLEIANKIHELFKINYTVRHIRRLLHQLGYSRVKPRPFHINKDPIKAGEIARRLKKNSLVWTKNG